MYWLFAFMAWPIVAVSIGIYNGGGMRQTANDDDIVRWMIFWPIYALRLVWISLAYFFYGVYAVCAYLIDALFTSLCDFFTWEL